MSGCRPAPSQALPGHSAARRLDVEVWCARDGQDGAVWNIAEETPVEIGFNGRPWVVMLASPCDLEDLAVGLSYTEGVIRDPGRIENFTISDFPEGITVDVAVAPGGLTDRARKFRALDGYTGCGLCGVETLADTVRSYAPGAASLTIENGAIAQAFGELKERQPLNTATRSVHAAGWCAPEGGILEVREDVGRHNALDKLIGALLQTGAEPGNGFFVMTSRCSMDLVQKAAAFGAPLLATISAPTFRALELASAAGLSIKCLGPDDTIVTFPLEPTSAEI